jgi:hypothetical protein
VNIKRVKYKMQENDNWKIGYVIGKYDGENKTLLNENFEFVPKIIDSEKEFIVYNMKDDLDKHLNISIPI